MDFGSALRYFREERTLSLRELAALSDVDHAYIHRLESGDKTSPSVEVLDRLNRGLKLSAAKRKLLDHLAQSGRMDPILFDLALETPEQIELVKVATTMSFRGARPTSKEEWKAKLAQIAELIGHAGR